MKRFWIAMALFITLLALSLWNGWYAHHLTQQWSQQLKNAQQLVIQNRWEEAAHLTAQTSSDWDDHHFYLHVFMRHSDTDQVTRAFRTVEYYLVTQNLNTYLPANQDLITQLTLLAEMEAPSLVNIL